MEQMLARSVDRAEVDGSAISEDLPVARLLDLPLDLDRSVRIPRTVHDVVDDVIIPSLTRHDAGGICCGVRSRIVLST